MDDDSNSVSVVLLTKNSAETVERSLESIFRQTRKPDEVVVIDGNSSDGTVEILKRYPVSIVSEPGLGYGYARNLGVSKATGDIIFFIDSDCYAEPQWIEKALPHFYVQEIGGVTGPTNLSNKDDSVARFLAIAGHRVNMPKERMYVSIAPTMNLAVRRNVVNEVGGFDETLRRGEDTDLTYRISMKYKILYEPKAVMWFRGSQTLMVASRKCIDHFIGVGQLLAKHGFDRSFVRLNLPLRGLILVAALASIFLAPWYLYAFLFSILFADFFRKTMVMYVRYHDTCVIYYFAFFTFWSLVSLVMSYGLYLGLKSRRKQSVCLNINMAS